MVQVWPICVSMHANSLVFAFLSNVNEIRDLFFPPHKESSEACSAKCYHCIQQHVTRPVFTAFLGGRNDLNLLFPLNGCSFEFRLTRCWLRDHSIQSTAALELVSKGAAASQKPNSRDRAIGALGLFVFVFVASHKTLT